MKTPNSKQQTGGAFAACPGSANPRWGMGAVADKQMELLEAILKRHDAAVEHAFKAENDAESKEIVEEGVQSFMAASAGVGPQQRLMVGVKYCLLALYEWRKHGPEGDSQTVTKLSDAGGKL